MLIISNIYRITEIQINGRAWVSGII